MGLGADGRPARGRASGGRCRRADPGGGFETAKRLLGSKVERVEINAYDLSPERLGSFDVVTCGSLLLHLRDPVRALTAIHSVCGGQLMSAEEISLVTTLVSRRRALYELRAGERCQWWIPNPAAHLKLLRAAGFEALRRSRPYAIPLAPAHPSFGRRERPLKRLAQAGRRSRRGRATRGGAGAGGVRSRLERVRRMSGGFRGL